MDARFNDRIASGHALFRRRRIFEAAVLGASFFLPALAAGIGLAMLFRFRALGGWTGPAGIAAGLLAGCWIAARFALRHHLTRDQFLRHLERRLGLRENDLINAAEMEGRLGRIPDPLSRGLAGLAVEAGDRTLAPVSFARLAPALRLRRSLARIGGSALALAILGLAAPGAFTGAVARLARPGAHELPPSIAIQVDPGNVTVERGASVLVRARLAQGNPAEPELLHRAPGGIWRRVPMAAAPSGETSAEASGGDEPDPAGAAALPPERAPAATGRLFAASLSSVLEPTDYVVAAGRAESETYRVRVIEPLRATGYQRRIEFPAYTGLAPVQELGADGNFSALAGSRATLIVFPSRAGARGRLLVEGEAPQPLTPAGREELVATLPVRRTLEYRVELTSEEAAGVRWQSDRFTLEAVADRLPAIFQLAPERNLVMPPEMAVHLEIDCTDDFGLTRCDLVYRRNEEPARRERLATWQGNREARVSWPWDLGDLGLIPGDRIRYHLEVTDNDAVTGPKTASSPEGEIRLPSFDEMYASLDEDRDQQVESAREALERQKDVSEDLKSALQEMRQNKNFRWEEQEQVKDLAERQERVAQQVQELAQAMERSLEKMERSSAFSPEVLEKVQQINDLVREIESPEFREQLARLQQALASLDRNEVQRAMQNLQLTQEQLLRNLDRTIEMLKQIQREETLDHLIQQAEKLLDEQRRLNEELRGEPADSMRAGAKEPNPGERRDAGEQGERRDGEGDRRDQAGESPADTAGVRPELTPEQSAELRQRQDALREELAQLQAEMKKLAEEAQKHWEKLSQEMSERKSEEQLSSASKQMEKASGAMAQKKRRSGLSFGRQAQQKLEEFARDLRQAQAAMSGAEQEEIARRLYALAGDLVTVSQDQEELLRTAPARSTRELAREQQRLTEGARRTLDSLFALARRSQFINSSLARAMGEAVRTLESAQQAWTEGRRPNGMEDGGQAGRAVDATVLSLMNAGESMCKGGASGSCSNPLQRMRSLSGEQESLNQETQQMLGSCSGGQRLSPSGSEGERLLQAAARQEMIRQGLAELEQSMQNESGLMGRIGDIGREMGEVVEEMRHRGLDERVIRRQERILSRLLTAQRSLRKEGQKEERFSRTGVNPEDRESPAPYAPGPNEWEALQRGILRGSQDPVPGDFRRVVESYFRSLGARR